MKIHKMLLRGLFFVAMAMVLPLSALAAGPMVSVDKVPYDADATSYTISVRLTGTDRVCAGGLTLQYDSNCLAIKDCKAGEALLNTMVAINQNYRANAVRLSWAGTLPVTTEEPLLALSFILTGQAPAMVSLESVNLTDGDGNAVSVGRAHGGIFPADAISKPTDELGQTADPAVSFTDLAGYAWAEEAILKLARDGIVSGYDGKFFPGANITRGDFALLLVRALGAPQEMGNSFLDVPPSNYAYAAISTAHRLGLMQGVGGGMFRPGEPITRQELFTIVHRAMGQPTPKAAATLNAFQDGANVAPWARDAVAWLTEEEYLLGAEGKIMPDVKSSRAETAVFLMRVLPQMLTR